MSVTLFIILYCGKEIKYYSKFIVYSRFGCVVLLWLRYWCVIGNALEELGWDKSCKVAFMF